MYFGTKNSKNDFSVNKNLTFQVLLPADDQEITLTTAGVKPSVGVVPEGVTVDGGNIHEDSKDFSTISYNVTDLFYPSYLPNS